LRTRTDKCLKSTCGSLSVPKQTIEARGLARAGTLGCVSGIDVVRAVSEGPTEWGIVGQSPKGHELREQDEVPAGEDTHWGRAYCV